MLTCRGCMRHFLRAIVGEIGYLPSTTHSTRSPTLQSIQREFTHYRYFHLPTAKKATSGRYYQRFGQDPSKNVPLSSIRRPEKSRPPGYYGRDSLDPVRLAEFVKGSLKRDQVLIAADAIRNASTRIQCVVSWNHLIDWWMSKGKMKSAISIFHEMKKRGQIPDAYTYTIIFRGCAQHEHSEQALGKVMAIYQSMLLDKSPIKPNSIHMNSVIKMCAVAGDLESVLSLASGMPSRGIGASNAMTFVIIINAIRYNATSHLPKALADTQRTKNIRAAILQATHLWDDIIDRWKKGDLTIDEDLVCAMGRLLLISEDKRHWDEVLSIVEQTMAIPRQIPPLSSPDRWGIEPDFQSQNSSELMKYSQPNLSDDSSDQISSAGENLQDTSLNIAAAPPESSLSIATASITSGIGSYAKAGRNSLSLVLKALLLLSQKDPATKYWEIFTNQHHVEPDLENYVSYLRILRISRASTQAVEVLEKIHLQHREPKVFRLAMSSCVRDKNNHNSFLNSGKILDMMHAALKEPDIPTVTRYLQLALSSTHLIRECPPEILSQLIHINPEKTYVPGENFCRALDRVDEVFLSIKSYLDFTDPGLEKKTELERRTYLQDAETLLNLSVKGHYLLLAKKILPDKLTQEMHHRRIRHHFVAQRLRRRIELVSGTKNNH